MGRILLIGAAVLLLAGGGAIYGLWHAATSLPDWYVASRPTATAPTSGPGSQTWDENAWEVLSSPEEPEAAGERTDRSPEPEASYGVASGPASSRPRPRHVLRNFHVRATVQNPAWRPAVRASRATYHQGRLEAGLVVNLSRLRLEGLRPVDRDLVRRAAKSFPTLRDQEVYIGVEDTPTTDAEGYLQLTADTLVRVGNLRQSLASVARRLGLEPPEVRAQLNAELRRLRVRAPGSG
jgi:hypothetical protein